MKKNVYNIEPIEDSLIFETIRSNNTLSIDSNRKTIDNKQKIEKNIKETNEIKEIKEVIEIKEIKENKEKVTVKKNKIDRLLGFFYITTCYRNSYMTIKLLRYGKTTEEYLVKQYNMNYIRENDKKSYYINEIEVAKRISDFDLVLKIKFPYKSKNSIDILYHNFPLILKFNSINKKPFNLDLARFYFANFFHLFHYLNERKIILRNFDYENVFVDSNTGYIKYINYDSFKIMDKDKCYTLVGKEKYLSPEMINYSGYNNASNHFLLGILMYEFLHGYNPFENSDPMLTYRNILTENYKEIKCDRDIKLLIKQLLIKDVKKRLGSGIRSINEITSHKCFMSFNWDNFVNRTMKFPMHTEINENYSIEQYYAREYENSPTMKNYLNMIDKPWKDQETNDKNQMDHKKILTDKEKKEIEIEMLNKEYFEFMDQYEDFN